MHRWESNLGSLKGVWPTRLACSRVEPPELPSLLTVNRNKGQMTGRMYLFHPDSKWRRFGVRPGGSWTHYSLPATSSRRGASRWHGSSTSPTTWTQINPTLHPPNRTTCPPQYPHQNLAASTQVSPGNHRVPALPAQGVLQEFGELEQPVTEVVVFGEGVLVKHINTNKHTLKENIEKGNG